MYIVVSNQHSKHKLKLKLTPFDIAHHSKGNPFQVRLTVSTDYID